MNSVLGVFHTNDTVVALANLGGVLGLIAVAASTIRNIYRFGKRVWHGNLKLAVQEYRRKYLASARIAAKDLHFFIGMLYFKTVRVVICIIYVLLPEQPNTPAWNWPLSHEGVLAAITITKTIVIFLGMVLLLEPGYFITLVGKYRGKILRRQFAMKPPGSVR